MDGNFKFQVQDGFVEYSYLENGRFEKRIALSEKKPPLKILGKDIKSRHKYNMTCTCAYAFFTVVECAPCPIMFKQD